MNWPNLLCCARLAAAPVLLVLAWKGSGNAFLGLLALALASDAVDGWLARRLHQKSELGARLDGFGDIALCAAVPLGALWLWPDVLEREGRWIAAALAGYAVPGVAGLARYRRLPSYHTWGAKAATGLMGASVLLLFLGGPPLPFRAAVVLVLLKGLEELAITAALPRWEADVPSLWHALRRRRRA